MKKTFLKLVMGLFTQIILWIIFSFLMSGIFNRDSLGAILDLVLVFPFFFMLYPAFFIIKEILKFRNKGQFWYELLLANMIWFLFFVVVFGKWNINNSINVLIGSDSTVFLFLLISYNLSMIITLWCLKYLWKL